MDIEKYRTEREIAYEILDKNPNMKGSQLRKILEKDFGAKLNTNLTSNWVYLYNHKAKKRANIVQYIPIKKSREEELIEFKSKVYESNKIGEIAAKQDEYMWELIHSLKDSLKEIEAKYSELKNNYLELNKIYETLKVEYSRLSNNNINTVTTKARMHGAMCEFGEGRLS